MEKIIKDEYKSSIKRVDNFIKESKTIYNRIKKNKSLSDNQDIMNLILIYEVCIPAAEIDLYSKLMEITQEKYLGIKYELIGTDCINPIENFLMPYFNDNNVNYKLLYKIANYKNKKSKIINKYINKSKNYTTND